MDKTFEKFLHRNIDLAPIGLERREENPTAESSLPEWKVFFDGSFWGHQGRDHAGTEIRIDRQFDWAGHHWVIPAAYSCSKGLVIDFCMRVGTGDILSFLKKWNLSPENDSCENFTPEQQMQIELENPLCLNFNPRLELSKKTMRTPHGCSVCFNPCLPDEMINDQEAKRALEHYRLDMSYGWVISRNAFPWPSRRRPEITSLILTMEQQPNSISGPHFKVHAPGDTFTFTHPVNRTEYTLTVQELQQQILPKNSFRSDRCFYPTHFTVMSYTLSPEPDERITIFDCDDGDKPQAIAPGEDHFNPVCSSSICMIGGADGPTTILFGGNSQNKLCTACSSLHFEPVQDDIEWRTVFNLRQFETKSFLLI